MPAHGSALAIALVAASASLHAQGADSARVPRGEARQVVDSAYVPAVRGPAAFPLGRGPRVVIDEAHRNFHTASGRYRPFAHLLEADGFRVDAGRAPFDSATLAATRVLVIANAVGAGHERNTDWALPAVSAFTPDEIAAVGAWVRRGGALLLIADHMPFAGDAAALAEPLGIHFLNGFALVGDADPETGDYPIVFRRRDGSLGAHRVTAGRTPRDRVDSIVSFTGSAFRVTAPAATPLMTLPAATRVHLPRVAWQFSDSTAELSGDGLLQGAVLSVGRGRVAVFGEAAMFTAQRKGIARAPMGMNAPAAAQNARFVLNVMRWLAGVR
ncbi:MAG: DUF4350 domain-containing protein [Gemmatirosa sp.]|nr:DUF4350 domain-containing protein [Gemmatirosa sp.]